MTQDEATALIAKLYAAFPAARRENATTQVYAEVIARWEPERALHAVNDAIREHRDSRSLPPVAVLTDAYRSLRDRYLPAALTEPPPSPEQMAENARQARAFVERLRLRGVA